VLDIHTGVPSGTPTAAVRWLSTGRRGTAYDWLGARGSLPLPGTPLGVVAAAETRLDDAYLPQRPSRGRQPIAGGRYGWRNDNHELGWVKLAPARAPQAFSIEAVGARVVTQPYDPMITWNDSLLIQPGGMVFYRAADHQPMTETRQLTTLAQATLVNAGSQWHVAVSWQHAGDLTSPGLVRDPEDVTSADKVRVGEDMDPKRDPFRAYAGVWPYFRHVRSDRIQATFSGSLVRSARNRIGFGCGGLWDDVDFRELDSA